MNRKFSFSSWSQGALYKSVVGGSVAVSAAGIIWGILSCNPTNGQRGGAVAVALAFWVLFLRRDHGSKLQKAIQSPLPSLGHEQSQINADRTDPEVLRTDIDAINTKLAVEA